MSTAPKLDPNRLAAGCILAHGRHDRLAGRDSILMQMSPEGVDQWLRDLPEPETEDDRHTRWIFAEIAAEVKAWKLIERVREASAPRRNRKASVKGGAA